MSIQFQPIFVTRYRAVLEYAESDCPNKIDFGQSGDSYVIY